MKTDTLLYRFFQELPESFFEVIGRPAIDALRFRFEAIEFKQTAVRIDGVYSPREPDERESVYFVEYQNQRSERTYSNLVLKVGLYLEKVNPRQNWHAVVIYPSKAIEQTNLHPYRWLLQSEQMTRVYLDELLEPPEGNIGLGVLRLISSAREVAADRARHLISQIRGSQELPDRRLKLIELIETVVLYQWPLLTRKEVEKMLQVDDIRETKVYKEAYEEGREEGMEMVARRLLAERFSVEKIAKLTGLSPDAIKRLKKKPRK